LTYAWPCTATNSITLVSTATCFSHTDHPKALDT